MGNKTFRNTPSSHIPNLSGCILEEANLRLEDVLGQGSWGVVYRGVDVDNPESVYAVKCMAKGAMSYDQKCSIAKEVGLHTIASAATSKAVQLIDVFEDADTGLMFIVTEFCESGDLLEGIVNKSYIGNDELIRDTYIQILDGLEACHKANVYHRDLKPENIFLKDGGKTVVIGDFGFATHKKTCADFRLGSEPFMSPELRGGAYSRLPRYSSAQSDMWALGVVLMNLVSGCLPWGKASTRDPHFMRYVMIDEDYLLHTFPISRAVNEVFKLIFTMDPANRITIPELRKKIMKIKTFGPGRRHAPAHINAQRQISDDFDFDTDSDTLSDVSQTTRDAQFEAATLQAVDGPVASEVDITDLAANLVENDDFNARIPIRVVAPSIIEVDITDQYLSLETHSDYEFYLNGGMVSDPDSEGPITPETHAVDEAAVAGANGAAALEDIEEFDLGDGTSIIRTEAQGVAIAKGRKPVITIQNEPCFDESDEDSADENESYSVTRARILRKAAKLVGLPVKPRPLRKEKENKFRIIMS